MSKLNAMDFELKHDNMNQHDMFYCFEHLCGSFQEAKLGVGSPGEEVVEADGEKPRRVEIEESDEEIEEISSGKTQALERLNKKERQKIRMTHVFPVELRIHDSTKNA